MRASRIANGGVGGDGLARQQPADDVEARLQGPGPAREPGSHPPELVLAVAQPHLEHEGTLGQGRQGADLLGHQHRVPQGQQEQRPRRPVAPLGQQAAEDRDVLEVGRPGHVVVADEQRVEAGGPGRPGPFHHLRDRCPRSSGP